MIIAVSFTCSLFIPTRIVSLRGSVGPQLSSSYLSSLIDETSVSHVLWVMLTSPGFPSVSIRDHVGGGGRGAS